MLPFELLYRDFRSFEKDNDQIVFAKNKLRNITFSSFKAYNIKEHKFENISKREQKAFSDLLNLENIIIQKADKGNVIVIIDNTCITKISSIPSDESEFVKVKFRKKNKDLDYLTI